MTPWQDAARSRKAGQIATILSRYGITVAEAQTMTGEEWAAVARAHGIRPPSAEAVAVVLDYLSRAHGVRS